MTSVINEAGFCSGLFNLSFDEATNLDQSVRETIFQNNSLNKITTISIYASFQSLMSVIPHSPKTILDLIIL